MERLRIDSETVTKTYEEGTVVTATTPDLVVHNTSDVADHEAKHAVVAKRVKKVTIVPTSEYGGATWLEDPEDIAAITAPAADGHSGVGHDMFIAENVLGVDRGAALAAGRAGLSGKRDEVYEFAVHLDKVKTSGQSGLDMAIQKAHDKRRGIYEVDLSVTRPGEKIVTFPTKTYGGEIPMSVLRGILPKAA